MSAKLQSQSNGQPKTYYAVAVGHPPQAPGIFDTWAKVHPLVTGFPGAKHRSFRTLSEAATYMKANGIAKYQLVLGVGDDEAKQLIAKPSASKTQRYDTVPEGRQPGKIHPTWDGSSGAKENTSGYPGAAHKRRDDEKTAKQFNGGYQHRRYQLAPTTVSRAPDPDSLVVHTGFAEVVGQDETDPWFTNPFLLTRMPVDQLTALFGNGMNLGGTVSGGTRLTRTDPDGTQWTREEVYSYNFETRPAKTNGRGNGGPRQAHGYDSRGWDSSLMGPGPQRYIDNANRVRFEELRDGEC